MPRIGTQKLYNLLRKPLQALHIGRDKLFMIMKANGLDIKPRRAYHKTTNSFHRFKKHKNLIAEMLIYRPEQVWVSDITYIGSRDKHNYLALITDAYSKKIVGYDISNSLNSAGAIRALKMAIKGRKYPNEPLIHHSDRGVQYCCNRYQHKLINAKISTSMTESYDPYANAVAERINGILKDEFELEKYAENQKVLQKVIEQSIDKYNNKRPHFSCYMMTPNQMHKQKVTLIKTYKNKKRPKNKLETLDNILCLS